MANVFRSFRVGDGRGFGLLQLFPIFSAEGPRRCSAYRLGSEGIADRSVVVSELSAGGTVGQLKVQNKGDVPVLFFEGEQVLGAKQNRVFNMTVLIAARQEVTVPVSCVERRRWDHTPDTTFGAADTMASVTTRSALKGSVSRSSLTSGEHTSDQGAVWHTVSDVVAGTGTHAPTDAMEAVYEQHASTVADYVAKLPCPEDAVGLALVLPGGEHGTIVSLDIFDSAETTGKVWERYVKAAAVETARFRNASAPSLERDAVERRLYGLDGIRWHRREVPGLGKESRGTYDASTASVLAHAGTVVHASIAG